MVLIGQGKDAAQKPARGPHVNALQIKKMDDAGSMVVQALDREPRWGVQGSQDIAREYVKKDYKGC